MTIYAIAGPLEGGLGLSDRARRALLAAEAVVTEAGSLEHLGGLVSEAELHELTPESSSAEQVASLLEELAGRLDFVVWLSRATDRTDEVTPRLEAAGLTFEPLEGTTGDASEPLAGWKVIVTRAASQSSRLVAQLELLGGEALEVPTIEIAPPSDGGKRLEANLAVLSGFSHICFTSANAVEQVMDRLASPERLDGLVVAAVGPATAAALAARGVRVDLLPATANAEALARGFPPARTGESVFLPQGSLARPALARALAELGYEVEAVEAYQTLPAPADHRLVPELESCQAITFTSPSGFENFCGSYGKALLPAVIASIGPVTSRAIESAGLQVSLEAERASTGSLVAGLGRLVSRQPRRA